MSKLMPPDLKRCQAEIVAAHGPFRFGPKPIPQRCPNVATVVGKENKVGADGRRCAMSLCTECFAVFVQRNPPDYATWKEIARVIPRRRTVREPSQLAGARKESTHE